MQFGTDAVAMYMNSTTSTAIRFGTNSIERLRINNAGNIGIGTTTPTAKLEVAGQAKINNGINLNRIGSPLTGIKYYTDTFKAWQQYMAPAGAGQ